MSKPKVALDRSHISELICESVPYTVYDARWIPTSARFVAVGSRPRATGALQVYEMNLESKGGQRLVKTVDIETKDALKCSTFQATDPIQRHIAVGTFHGVVETYDLNTQKQVISVKAHDEIVNAIDGGAAPGPCELITGSRDGTVRVTDIRTGTVVASLVPEGDRRDCWAVTAGGTTGPQDRTVLAGFDNGDIKLWDLRASQVSWETNLRNGVVSCQFDQRTSPLKYVTIGCLSGQIVSFDLSEKPEGKGFASVTQKVKKDESATVWVVQHCPQQKSIVATTGGSGEVMIWRRNKEMKLERVTSQQLTTQPISSYDWHPDKEGPRVMACFDQTIRVSYVPNLRPPKK